MCFMLHVCIFMCFLVDFGSFLMNFVILMIFDQNWQKSLKNAIFDPFWGLFWGCSLP